MPCVPIKTPGSFGIACSRGLSVWPVCYQCKRRGQWLCDFQVTERKTCDRPICAEHGKSASGNRDYCLEHAPAQAPAAPGGE